MSAMLQDAPEVLAAYKEYKQFSANPAVREKARVRRRFLEEKQILLNDAWESQRRMGGRKRGGKRGGKDCNCSQPRCDGFVVTRYCSSNRVATIENQINTTKNQMSADEAISASQGQTSNEQLQASVTSKMQ